MLNWNKYNTLLWCFHSRLSTSKCQLGLQQEKLTKTNNTITTKMAEIIFSFPILFFHMKNIILFVVISLFMYYLLNCLTTATTATKTTAKATNPHA